MEHAPHSIRLLRPLLRDQRGSTIVEAAIALPLMIVMLMGAISYGMWFMSAHSLQEAANEGARAAMAGLDADERETIVTDTVTSGVLSAGTIAVEGLDIVTRQEGNLLVVELTYDASSNAMLRNPLVPLPSATIVRRAAVHLSTI
jgi:Flp pilus assembly protein TadG